MALVTRCPNCATAFRVTPLHLQAHGGDVRCGHCAKIFDGFATLATIQEPETANFPKVKPEAAPESADRTPPQDDLATQTVSNQKLSPSVSGHEIRHGEPVSGTAGQDAPPMGPPVGEASIQQTKGANSNGSTVTPAGEDQPARQASGGESLMPENYGPENYAPENYASHNYVQEDHVLGNYPFDDRQPQKISPGWSVGSLFLLVMLAAQALYLYRAELAVMVPEARPFLERYCELLQCTIPPQ